MMALLFGIKVVIKGKACPNSHYLGHFVFVRTQLLSGKLSYPFTICANLMKLAAIF